MKLLLLSVFSFFAFAVSAQSFVQKNIQFFGAKGDGKTNDQAAFNKAADYFNKRGGNVKLSIPKGTYIVGKQTFTGGRLNKPAYEGEDVMHLSNVKNFSVNGEVGAVIKFQNGMRMGSFSPISGKENKNGNNFVNRAYAAIPGTCIYIDNSTGVTVSNIELDGNNQNIILGGVYGDVGRQLQHYGIFISNSKNVLVANMNVHHFGLDGISISNKPNDSKDSIQLLNSNFEYNSRQGLSWVSGNQLYVKNCKFNHTGKVKFSSPPGAGVDIEAEGGPIRNGIFENCEFIDNTGAGLVADSGDSGDCTFTDCTFWGTTNWSIWITKPGYTFH
ncbi:MAG: right-handed parallel beta-helix repeat-containing protein, partial [Ginsengibacter sp.]